jgi:NAD(P)-dependent dehydrogenase (short-subunit alcohol dehydrogenase family)
MESLSGKVAVVTGAARGFGLALATALAEEQMRVVLADNDAVALREAVASLHDHEVLGVPTDVSDTEAVDRLRDQAFARFGTAHVLCNNAGVGGGGPVCEPVDLERFESLFGINFYGVIRGVNAFLPRMLEQGEGHIVNTASRGGLLPLANLGAYVPSKFALVAYTEMLHAELALRGSPVGVTVLTPSGLLTPLLLEPYEAFQAQEHKDPALAAYFEQLVAAAVDPLEFARLAVRAIKTKTLYVNSHRATLDSVQQRLDRMVADADSLGTIR